MTPDLLLGERRAAPVRRRPLQRHLGRHPRHARHLGAGAPALRHLVARPARSGPASAPRRDGFTVDQTFFDQTDAERRPGSTTSRRPPRIYLDPDGTPRDVGIDAQNPDLARTYERIARRGADWFYNGPVAGAMASAAQHPPKAGDANHAWRPGLMTLRDLSRYRAIERRADPHRLPRPRRLGHGPALERRLDRGRGAQHPRGLQPTSRLTACARST